MPKAKSAKAPAAEGPNNVMQVVQSEKEAQAIARNILGPSFRHGMAASQLLKFVFSGNVSEPGLGDYADVYRARAGDAAKGDLKFASHMLAAQATTLDTIFAEMARRMASNIGEHLGRWKSMPVLL